MIGEYAVAFRSPGDEHIAYVTVRNEFPPSINNTGDLCFWEFGILKYAFAKGVWLRYWEVKNHVEVD